MKWQKMDAHLFADPVVPGVCEDCLGIEQDNIANRINYCLRQSTSRGHLDCMKACLAGGALVDYVLMRQVFEVGNDDCTKVLIKAGALTSYCEKQPRSLVSALLKLSWKTLLVNTLLM